jgi:hypothetical protein
LPRSDQHATAGAAIAAAGILGWVLAEVTIKVQLSVGGEPG